MGGKDSAKHFYGTQNATWTEGMGYIWAIPRDELADLGEQLLNRLNLLVLFLAQSTIWW